jgi:hypothetical protein
MARAAALLAVVALLAAAKQLPSSLRATQSRVKANAGLSSVQRELAPAREWGINEELVLRAAEILPQDAVFTTVGGRLARSTGAPFFYAYWLLPRRHTADLSASDWIVSWGADPSRLGVRVDVVADLGGGAEILRVKR